MNNFGRRDFLKTMGAAAAALPLSIEKALAIPAHNRTRSIQDVEHIVILTQENRSFDHYFGSMRGVRGFNDPRAVTLPSGKSVWHQPIGANELLPFRPGVPSVGNTFLPDVPHGWTDSHNAWNKGQYDQWVPNKGPTAMTYMNRNDIPYHYALADAFTVCDAYYCSVMGPTDPNRYYLWTGWLGNDGNGGGPVISNAEVGYDWSSFPELLEKAGISWKIYQDIGDGLTAAGFWGWTGDKPYVGNYGDNSLLYLHQYQNALPGTALADKAKTGTAIQKFGMDPVHLLDVFRADVASGKLPQVSWIAAPEAYTEHPNWAPNYGAWYMSQFVDILASNPELFSKTVFLVNYDEAGGFFDHLVPPTPHTSSADGASTVPTTFEIYPPDQNPYGLGTRVPMIVISPWSKGGYVNSQVFDHTSVIKFIETRFGGGLFETNISPWRRSITGDLTTAFNFKNPNEDDDFQLPSTSTYKPTKYVTYPSFQVETPTNQSVPPQEPGVRPARALPYSLHAHGLLQVSNGAMNLDFKNIGDATAVFQVRDGSNAHLPRTYTVEPGKTLSDSWTLGSIGVPNCDLSVYGPNGFFRGFKGSVSSLRSSQLDVVASYDTKTNKITLTIKNTATHDAKVSIANQYKGKSIALTIKGGATGSQTWSLNSVSGWYDLIVTTDADSSISYHFAGHLETGSDSISDPAMGGMDMGREGEQE